MTRRLIHRDVHCFVRGTKDLFESWPLAKKSDWMAALTYFMIVKWSLLSDIFDLSLPPLSLAKYGPLQSLVKVFAMNFPVVFRSLILVLILKIGSLYGIKHSSLQI